MGIRDWGRAANKLNAPALGDPGGWADSVSKALNDDDTTVNARIATHSNDTTAVHGIVDTAALALQVDVDALEQEKADIDSPALTGVPTAPVVIPSSLAARQRDAANPLAAPPNQIATVATVEIAIANDNAGALTDAIWWVDAEQVRSDGLALLDISGNGRDAVFGAGAAKPVVLPWDGEDYLHIPTAGQGVSIAMADDLEWTATRRDGSTVTGTHDTGLFTFATVGDWARIETGGGEVVLDPSQHHTNYTQIANTGTAGGDWVISRAASGYKVAVVDRPLVLFGGSQTCQVGGDGLPLTGDQTVMVAYRIFAQTINEAVIMANNPGANGYGVVLIDSPGGVSNVYAVVGAGGLAHVQLGTRPYGSRVTAARVRNDTLQLTGWAKADGTSVTSSMNAAMSGAPPIPWQIGSRQNAFAEMEFVAAAIWDRALTDAEIAEATDHLIGIPHSQQNNPHPQYVQHGEEIRVRPGNLVDVWDGAQWLNIGTGTPV